MAVKYAFPLSTTRVIGIADTSYCLSCRDPYLSLKVCCIITIQLSRGPWWRLQMKTFSALPALCAGNSPVPVNSPHIGQWRGALMFSLIYAWINDWENNREAGDLRHHRGHYDVIVMCPISRFHLTSTGIERLMHELPWITIFGSRVRRFANKFHEWRSHEWKSLANRITSDPKIVIHGNECITLFLTRFLMSWTHNSAKTIIDRWFRHCR